MGARRPAPRPGPTAGRADRPTRGHPAPPPDPATAATPAVLAACIRRASSYSTTANAPANTSTSAVGRSPANRPIPGRSRHRHPGGPRPQVDHLRRGRPQRAHRARIDHRVLVHCRAAHPEPPIARTPVRTLSRGADNAEVTNQPVDDSTDPPSGHTRRHLDTTEPVRRHPRPLVQRRARIAARFAESGLGGLHRSVRSPRPVEVVGPDMTSEVRPVRVVAPTRRGAGPPPPPGLLATPRRTATSRRRLSVRRSLSPAHHASCRRR